jgi:hypothetical protein
MIGFDLLLALSKQDDLRSPLLYISQGWPKQEDGTLSIAEPYNV